MTGAHEPPPAPDERWAIFALIHACFNATDRGDHEAKRRFFTADGVMRHGEEASGEVRGLAALAAGTEQVAKHFLTIHTLANFDVAVERDRAEAVTYAIANVVLRHEPRVLVRGLRYDDRLVRTEDGWRIAERRHSLLWQYETATVVPRSLFDYLP